MDTFEMLVEIFYNVSIRLSGVMSRNAFSWISFIVVGFLFIVVKHESSKHVRPIVSMQKVIV